MSTLINNMKLMYLGIMTAAFAGIASADYCKCSDGQPGTPKIGEATENACHHASGIFCGGMGYCKTDSTIEDACKSFGLRSFCVKDDEFHGKGFDKYC